MLQHFQQLSIIIPDIPAGKQIHASLINTTSTQSVVLRNALLNMYAISSLEEVLAVFNDLSQQKKDGVVTWNTMILAYGKHQKLAEARKLFKELKQNSTLDISSWNVMITLALNYGLADEALSLFHQLETEGY